MSKVPKMYKIIDNSPVEWEVRENRECLKKICNYLRKIEKKEKKNTTEKPLMAVYINSKELSRYLKDGWEYDRYSRVTGFHTLKRREG